MLFPRIDPESATLREWVIGGLISLGILVGLSALLLLAVFLDTSFWVNVGVCSALVVGGVVVTVVALDRRPRLLDEPGDPRNPARLVESPDSPRAPVGQVQGVVRDDSGAPARPAWWQPAPSASASAVSTGANTPCPRCAAKLAASVNDSGELACANGCGVLLDSSQAEHLVERAQLALTVVRELAQETGATKSACPTCGNKMRETRLRNIAVDLCLSCGAMWLDDGERRRLTRADAFSSSSASERER